MKISIVGTVGLPANYGGFETLVENLIERYHGESSAHDITVYCSSKSYSVRPDHHLAARLRYIPLQANGAQSIAYDIVSLLSAVWHRSNSIVVLGVSGAIALPLVGWLSRARIITNIDGIEWRRDKWQGFAKSFLRFSEAMAVRYSDDVIADNEAIADYVRQTYGITPHVIAYGGDHAVKVVAGRIPPEVMANGYAFAVCRIEPENNVHMALQAFAALPEQQLVFVGNWTKSKYGRELRQQYGKYPNIVMLDPIYDLGTLKSLRMHARLYVHGHSAGGTNPSLVEAMHFALPILAFDCNFNRKTTDDQAHYFKSADELAMLVSGLQNETLATVGSQMQAIALDRYTWEVVARRYMDLVEARPKVIT